LRVKDFRLHSGENPEVLGIALEPADVCRQLVERAFAVVAVWRVADVVRQAREVDDVGVATETDGHPSTDLGDLKGVRQPRARCLALPWPDDLGLVGQSAEGGTVQDPGPVAGEVGAVFGVGPRQGSTLRRFDHHALPVEV
jgi:hypothetical protein